MAPAELHGVAHRPWAGSFSAGRMGLQDLKWDGSAASMLRLHMTKEGSKIRIQMLKCPKE